MGGRKIKERNHSHDIFSVETGEEEAICQFRFVSTRWHHSASVVFVVICFLIMGQLSVLADMLVPCGKLVWGGVGGLGLDVDEGKKKTVWSGGEMGRNQVRT